MKKLFYIDIHFCQWRILFLAAFFSMVGKETICQVYPVTNFSVREGLINSNVYAITQDNSGFIWVGTENGLSRFDGIEFENYSQVDLNIDSHINSLWPNPDGTIIFGCGINGIYHFDPVSEKAERINKETVSQSSQLILKGDTIISMHEYHSFDILSRRTGKLLVRDNLNASHQNDRPLSIALLGNGAMLLGRQDGLYQLKNGIQQKIKITGFNDLPVYSICELPNGNFMLGSEGMLLEISENQVFRVLHTFKGKETRVRNIIKDKNNKIWYNTWGTNEIFNLQNNFNIIISDFLSIKTGSVTKIFMDRDGNIWVGTLGKGIYLFSNLHLTNYFFSEDIQNSNIRHILPAENNNLLLGTNDGIALFDPKLQTIYSEKQMPEMTQYVRDIAEISQGEYLAAITDIRLKSPISKPYKLKDYPISIKYAHGSSLFIDSTFLEIGNWDNCINRLTLPDLKFESSSTQIFTGKGNKLRINCQFRDANGRIWIGSQKGFCIILKDGRKIFPQSDFRDMEIYRISAVTDNKIMLVSNKGVSVFKNHFDITKIKETQVLKIDNTTCAIQLKPDEFLVGTQYGLHYISSNKKRLINIHDGLLSDVINDIYHKEDSSTAWLATPEGLIALDIDLMKKSFVAPPPSVVAVMSSTMGKFLPEEINDFDYGKSAFTIKFTSFHFANPKLLNYQFKVDDGHWNPVPSRELQYASMEPGAHLIQLRAGFPGYAWGAATEIKINVDPPFYRTYWFYFLTGTATFFLIFFFIKKQLIIAKQKQDEKSAIQQKLVEYQQKALASNLNPHFIFNSLNSIQHFINANNAADANDYLAKFSRLMRMHLNMADKSYISLAEEIKRLEFYLSLEQMRFGSRLLWKIELAPGISSYNLEIPNMIIQPFVENAIWHGIMPSETQGLISVKITQPQNDVIVITVSDNGVGYGKNKINGKQGHESKGVSLIENRLKLLDPKAFSIIEFIEGNPGTIVKITLSGKMVNLRENEPLPQ